KMALEPFWEARFEGTSYGFRPGRSTHDAVARIYLVINKKANHVLDADISKCFDKIDHAYLLKKLQCTTPVRKQVKAWLKAGIMDKGAFEKPIAGTPQRGVISPLLANIALDRMIRDVEAQFPKKQGKNAQTPIRIIRYADDFVVLHPELEVIYKASEAIKAWLAPVGLELKPEKTRICHTLNPVWVEESELTENPGFDFLGFTIRQFHIGKHHSGKSGAPVPHNLRNTKEAKEWGLLGFKTIIKPSKKAIKAHHAALKVVIKSERTAPQAGLIRLPPKKEKLSGWMETCRAAYNYGLAEIKDWCNSRKCLMTRCSIKHEYIMPSDLPFPNEIKQLNALPKAKKVFPRLGEVPSQVLQQAVKQLHRGWETFQARGTGFPRFKKYGLF
ncbi:reverse transcriptase domain-containing protein, partial [Phormidium pseudopriestleyi]|uniref:reverse transcriptase domain-containing protein n=1 Tax=Phormidium pseudopriestleyi TaxID=1759527 RepID=UPI001F5D8F03